MFLKKKKIVKSGTVVSLYLDPKVLEIARRKAKNDSRSFNNYVSVLINKDLAANG